MSIASDEAAISKPRTGLGPRHWLKRRRRGMRFFTEDAVTFDLAPPPKHTGFDLRTLEGCSRPGTAASATS